jgi:hypothetical protein
MTSPPPCGPWCIAPTETKTARIADRRRHHGADRRLGVAMVVHVGVVEHDLAPAAQGPAVVRLALDEAVDDAPAEVLGPIQRVVIGSGQRRVVSLPGFVRAILARVHGRVRSAAAGVLRADPDHAPLAIRAFILDGRLRRPPPRAAHRT